MAGASFAEQLQNRAGRGARAGGRPDLSTGAVGGVGGSPTNSRGARARAAEAANQATEGPGRGQASPQGSLEFAETPARATAAGRAGGDKPQRVRHTDDRRRGADVESGNQSGAVAAKTAADLSGRSSKTERTPRTGEGRSSTKTAEDRALASAATTGEGAESEAVGEQAAETLPPRGVQVGAPVGSGAEAGTANGDALTESGGATDRANSATSAVSGTAATPETTIDKAGAAKGAAGERGGASDASGTTGNSPGAPGSVAGVAGSAADETGSAAGSVGRAAGSAGAGGESPGGAGKGSASGTQLSVTAGGSLRGLDRPMTIAELNGLLVQIDPSLGLSGEWTLGLTPGDADRARPGTQAASGSGEGSAAGTALPGANDSSGSDASDRPRGLTGSALGGTGFALGEGWRPANGWMDLSDRSTNARAFGGSDGDRAATGADRAVPEGAGAGEQSNGSPARNAESARAAVLDGLLNAGVGRNASGTTADAGLRSAARAGVSWSVESAGGAGEDDRTSTGGFTKGERGGRGIVTGSAGQTGGAGGVSGERATRLGVSSAGGVAPAAQSVEREAGSERLATSDDAVISDDSAASSAAAGLAATAAAWESDRSPFAASADGGGGATPSSVERADVVEQLRASVEAQVARGLTAALRGDGGVVSVRLNPASLGAVRVRIELTDGRASVTFTAESAQARALLASSASSLRSALQAAGVELEGMTVEDETTGLAGAHEGATPGLATPSSTTTGGEQAAAAALNAARARTSKRFEPMTTARLRMEAWA